MKKLQPLIDPRIYKSKKVLDKEIVYELTAMDDSLPFGIAIADIEQSVPHFHNVITETYTAIQGKMEVRLGDETHTLEPGDVIKIPPGTVHSAKSLADKPARIIVASVPKWSQDDHFLVG